MSAEIEINVADIPENVYDRLNSLDLRSDLENGNIEGMTLRAEGYVGNRPVGCTDEFHEDDTWAIDAFDDNGNAVGYLYVSELEYNQDVELLKQFI